MAFTRDFPPGCGTTTPPILHPSYTSLHLYTRTYPSSLPSSSKPPKIYPQTDSSAWRRSIVAVKTNPISSFTTVTKPNPNGKQKGNERERVVEMLRLFRERCDNISRQDNRVKRVDVKANSELKSEGKIVNLPASMIGQVPGVEIGDRFYYRVELMIAGLHRLWQSGIDHMVSGSVKFATCIVATEKHLDKMNDPNVLMYNGEGGHLSKNQVGVPPDQQLKGGNLALLNSMKEKKPVRVVRGLSYGSQKQKTMYVYDGLYLVSDCRHKKGPHGNMTFEFLLLRCPAQPAVPWSEYRSC